MAWSKILDGAVVLAFEAIGVTAIVEGDGVIRVELDGLVEVLDGAVVLLRLGRAETGRGERDGTRDHSYCDSHCLAPSRRAAPLYR